MTTKALADFVASVQYDKLSPETVRITKQCILDWLGVGWTDGTNYCFKCCIL